MVLRLSISQSLDGLEQLEDLHTRATHFISFGMKKCMKRLLVKNFVSLFNEPVKCIMGNGHFG